ncbi:MAG: hypothetical protein IJ371_05210 [Clostridia bacterium]|nr:hypothetical protein [Clostridia bacterium]
MQLKYNVRGVVGKDIGEKEIKYFGKCIINYIYHNKYTPSIIIGKDNRVTSDYILNLLNSVLLKNGIEVNVVGVVTTPELRFLTKKFQFSLGVMITASHNSKEFNGFKCFDSCGDMVDIHKQNIKTYKVKRYEKVVDISKFKELYLRELKNRLNANKIKCVFDCANGASVEVVRKVFSKHQIIGCDTSGHYINDDYGSQCLDNVRTICKKYKKIGFAFDGDADRVVAIDERGEVIDGDKILYILATQKLGFGDKVVGTSVSSLGLEISLRRLGVNLIREKVGAKYVARRMKQENIILGGEGCGHIFSSSSVSDGVAVAIELINILERTGLNFGQLLTGYKQMYSLTKDIDINKVNDIVEFEYNDKEVRVVVRKSETEQVLRVFVEGESKDIVENKINNLIQELGWK